jgi:hypothetical protein
VETFASEFNIGRISIPRPRSKMRVPDFVLKTVGFIAESVTSDGEQDKYDRINTGFFVAIQSKVNAANLFFCFVTAKHVADDLKNREIAFIVNRRGGGVTTLRNRDVKWYFHPSDPSVDVAVLTFNVTRDLDILATPLSMFLDRATMESKQIGIGDEVFMPGLFTYAPGTRRNMPLVRYGTIAMLPDEPIQVESGFAEVYLIEARSIGGISGSPVFVRQTIHLQGQDAHGTDNILHGVGGEHFLLGLAHGHWDILERDLNEYSPIQDRQRGVNLGIGIVVPSHKILEVINHPELIRQRDEWDEEFRRRIVPTPD